MLTNNPRFRLAGIAAILLFATTLSCGLVRHVYNANTITPWDTEIEWISVIDSDSNPRTTGSDDPELRAYVSQCLKGKKRKNDSVGFGRYFRIKFRGYPPKQFGLFGSADGNAMILEDCSDPFEDPTYWRIELPLPRPAFIRDTILRIHTELPTHSIHPAPPGRDSQ